MTAQLVIDGRQKRLGAAMKADAQIDELLRLGARDRCSVDIGCANEGEIGWPCQIVLHRDRDTGLDTACLFNAVSCPLPVSQIDPPAATRKNSSVKSRTSS